MEKEVRMNKGSEDGIIRRRRHIHQQNIFLPMFCRLSIKDITLNQTKDRSNVPKPVTISSTVQLKRNKTVTAASASAAAVTGTPASNNLRSHMSRSMKKTVSSDCVDVEAVIIGNMSEMDPPLPVVKRVGLPGSGGDEVNIWKRRFNGAALKSLQIQHHQISTTPSAC